MSAETCDFFVQICRRDDAVVEVAEIEALVWRVRVLVGQADAKQDARQTELLLEGRDHRNRSTLAIEDRLLSETTLDRAPRRTHVLVVELGHPRLAAVHARDLQLHSLRSDLLD